MVGLLLLLLQVTGVSDFQSRLVVAAAAQANNSNPIFATPTSNPTTPGKLLLPLLHYIITIVWILHYIIITSFCSSDITDQVSIIDQ